MAPPETGEVRVDCIAEHHSSVLLHAGNDLSIDDILELPHLEGLWRQSHRIVDRACNFQGHFIGEA